MDLTLPARTIAPTLDVPVLLVLAGTTLPLTGNQISRLVTSGSKSGVFLVLKRLEQHGIIDVLEAGSSNLYSLNRDHVVAPAVLALIDLRAKLFGRISAAMGISNLTSTYSLFVLIIFPTKITNGVIKLPNWALKSVDGQATRPSSSRQLPLRWQA